jgi:hypothetical protein
MLMFDVDVHAPTVTEYEIKCVPAPAVAGLNEPAALVPGPLHVPPGVAAVKLTADAVMQKGPAGVIAAFGDASTTMLTFDVAVQDPTVTE